MKKDQIIGYAYMVGDPIHRWHIQALKNAKAFCDVLIVGVLTEKATMEKKPKPVLSFEERLFIINELKPVDAVVIQATYSPLSNVVNILPDILFESTSHRKTITIKGMRVIIMPYFPNQSSSKIKERIRGK